MANAGDVRIAASLVRYLRKGVKRELIEASESLAIQYATHLHTELDADRYYKAIARFQAAQELFDAVGVNAAPKPTALVLDLSRWPRLVLKALLLEYDANIVALESVAADGIELQTRDLPALEDLLAEIRKKVRGRRQRRERSLNRTPGDG
jgi:hypothetical protein